MTDSTGAIKARNDYDPYGRRTSGAGNPDPNFGFTGHYFHAPSGLHLALYRAYDADTGSWLSRDPVEEEGGINLYGYVENDPINSLDALGQNRVKINLPDGYSGAVDQWNKGGGPDFEIHVYDKQKNEVAILNSNGGYYKTHGDKGLKRPRDLPKDVKKSLRKQVTKRRKSCGIKAAGGVGALLLLANMAASAADGSNDAQIEELVDNIMQFGRHKAEGDEANADGDAAAIARGLQNLFGSDTRPLTVGTICKNGRNKGLYRMLACRIDLFYVAEA